MREVERYTSSENTNSHTRKVLNENATSLIIEKIATVIFEKAAKR